MTQISRNSYCLQIEFGFGGIDVVTLNTWSSTVQQSSLFSKIPPMAMGTLTHNLSQLCRTLKTPPFQTRSTSDQGIDIGFMHGFIFWVLFFLAFLFIPILICCLFGMLFYQFTCGQAGSTSEIRTKYQLNCSFHDLYSSVLDYMEIF